MPHTVGVGSPLPKICAKITPTFTAVLFDKLEFTYFLSGKKVIAAPAIPIIEKIKDHLKDKSKNGAFPKPSIKRMLTNIIAMPCSCFFIKSHSFVKFKFID